MSTAARLEHRQNELDAAARADYDRLRELNLGVYPELGQPIDPMENGPLGPLWPKGPPEWFAQLTNESTE
jgi:hypothetical protein